MLPNYTGPIPNDFPSLLAIANDQQRQNLIDLCIAEGYISS